MHYAQHCCTARVAAQATTRVLTARVLSECCILCADAYAVCMQIARHAQTHFRIKFQKYDQSSRCYGMSDSSVSYAAAVVTAEAG